MSSERVPTISGTHMGSAEEKTIDVTTTIISAEDKLGNSAAAVKSGDTLLDRVVDLGEDKIHVSNPDLEMLKEYLATSQLVLIEVEEADPESQCADYTDEDVQYHRHFLSTLSEFLQWYSDLRKEKKARPNTVSELRDYVDALKRNGRMSTYRRSEMEDHIDYLVGCVKDHDKSIAYLQSMCNRLAEELHSDFDIDVNLLSRRPKQCDIYQSRDTDGW